MTLHEKIIHTNVLPYVLPFNDHAKSIASFMIGGNGKIISERFNYW